MDTFKKLNLGSAIIFGFIAGASWIYWYYICGSSTCDVYFIRGTLKPICFGALSLAIISASLLPFPSKLFKHWLIHVASWSILLSLYFIIIENPRDSGVLAFGRGLLSWVFGTLIFILTVIYATLWHLYFWKKGSVQKRDLLKLLWLVVPAVLIKYGWQLF